MEIDALLEKARFARASDVHISSERNVMFRVDGVLQETDVSYSSKERVAAIRSMLSEEQLELMKNHKDIDFCYTSKEGFRHRANVYYQQQKPIVSIRLINERIYSLEELNLPPVFRDFAETKNGLVLVTGPTGSGKSTTLAAMISHINETRDCHILTVEDPVEYVYKQKRALIHQRDVGVDVPDFTSALRSAMREDPDVILIGEMRDYETISAAITAAETGHLVFSTLHTRGAAETIDRIIDAFPPHNQQQIRTQLASVLKGVVTQTLVPRALGVGRVAAFEIMTGTDAILNLIRENKCHQIRASMETSSKQGMVLLDDYLAKMVRRNEITKEAGLVACQNKTQFERMLMGG